MLGVGFLLAGTTLSAQIVETPIPFDSTGRVQSITPPLAARLGLTAPLWPVEGDFTEVRLYELSTGGFVLAASRPQGAISRYSLTAEQRAELQAWISEAMTRVGRPATEENPELISERAGGAFMRNQMLLAFSLYGGSLATLVNDGTASAAVYLMAPAATFFIAGNYARQRSVSRAQNHLATDGAWRAAWMANGLLYALGVEDSPRAYAAATFAGGLGGTIAGIRAGRGMTDGEAHGATWGSTSTAVTTLGLLGASGVLEGSPNSGRVVVGALLAAGASGYPLGLRYVRRARYVITAGDVTTLAVASLLGVSTAVIPIVAVDDFGQFGAGILTVGFLGGQIVGDRALVRPYDHTGGEGFLVALGATAGALMGGGVAVLGGGGSAVAVMSLLTGGAIGGVVLTERMIEPRRAGGSAPRRAATPESGRPRLALSPAGVALTMAGVPGRASFLTITF